MDETGVRRLLELASAGQEPPSRVDVELARSRAHRKLWWRRAGLAGASAAAVVAVLVGAVATSGSGGAAPGRGRAPEAHGPVIAPRQFSLRSPYVAFGWLPPGESLYAGTIGPKVVYLTTDPDRSWALTVYAAGFCNLTSQQVLRELGQRQKPQVVCKRSGVGEVYPVTSVAGARVDGHAAFWTTPEHTYLIWQYAHNSWALLQPPAGAVTSTAIKIASSVRYGVAGSPVEYEAQLVNMPAGWTLKLVHYQPDAGVLRASETILTGPDAGVSVPSLATVPHPGTTGGSCYRYPRAVREKINGYEVTVNHIPASDGEPPAQQVCAPNADGLTVYVYTYGDHASPNAVGIFRHLRFLGTNPADWTTEPLG